MTETINCVGQFTGENSACIIITNKTFDEKALLNFSWCLTVSSVTFMLCSSPTLNDCFHINQQINQSINN